MTSIWDGSGDTLVVNADNTYKSQRFIGLTKGQSLITITDFAYATGTNSLFVFLNGVSQYLNVDYAETSGTSITFNQGLRTDDVVVIIGLVGSDGAASAADSAARAEAALAAIEALALPALPLGINNGGTGQITKELAFKALAPAPAQYKAIGSLNGTDFTEIEVSPIFYTDITDNVTIPANALGYHSIAMSTFGKRIRLPDATLLSLNSEKAVLDNTSGQYPVGVEDFTGTLLYAIDAGGVLNLALKNGALPAGVWKGLGSKLVPAQVLLDFIHGGSYTSFSGNTPILVMDNNTTVAFVAITSGGFAVYAIDSLGKVITTPVTVSITAGDTPAQVFKIDATTFICFYYSVGANTSRAVIINITGASPTLGFTVNTFKSAASGSAFASEDSVSAPKIVQLSTTTYAVAYAVATTAGQAYCEALTVAGNVITFGAQFTIDAAISIQPECFTAYALTNTTALVIYGTNSPSQWVVRVLVVTGNTCTMPVAGTNALPRGTFSAPTPSVKLAGTKIVLSSSVAGTSTQAACATITGTSITVTTLSIESNADQAVSAYSINDFNRINPALYPISLTQIIFSYFAATILSRSVVLTENAGTLTAGPINYGLLGPAADSQGSFIAGTATEFLVVRHNNTNTTVAAYTDSKLTPVKLTGTAFSVGVGKTVDSVSNVKYNVTEKNAGIAVSAGKYIHLNVNNSYALNILKSNGDIIYSFGTVQLPTLNNIRPNIPLIAPNKIALIGDTGLQGSTGGAGNKQIRIQLLELTS